MVALQNGGLALDVVRQWLQMSWAQVFDAAAGTPAGAGGVSVIPYLTGERGAVAQPTSRGAWLGLSDTTTAQDLARAAVEGMVFAVARGVEVLAGSRDRIRMTGGGARNPVVVQALADLLGARVDVLPDRSASAIGAAMLAAAGVGRSLPVAGDPPTTYEPQVNPALRSAYEQWEARAAAADL
jgi:xylulokinase